MTPFVNVTSSDEGVPGRTRARRRTTTRRARSGYLRARLAGRPAAGGDLVEGHGSPVDFTSPAARARGSPTSSEHCWPTARSRPAPAREPPSAASRPTTARAATDRTPTSRPPPPTPTAAPGVEMRNGYASSTTGRSAACSATDGLLFARSGFAGTQAFPGCWAGDNEPNFGDERAAERHRRRPVGRDERLRDLGPRRRRLPGHQFQRRRRPNLFMRWTQFGCFSPIMQMHRQVTKSSSTLELRPAGARQLPLLRPAAHAAVSVLSYLREAGERDGLPIMRPLVLMNQDRSRDLRRAAHSTCSATSCWSRR